MPHRTIILGAAGRDFHDFNVYFRDNPDYDLVAFTAAQIPNIDDRRYPVFKVRYISHAATCFGLDLDLRLFSPPTLQ